MPEISVACSHISGRDRRQATLADERLQSLSDSSLHDRRRLLPADTGNPVTRRRRFVADRGDHGPQHAAALIHRVRVAWGVGVAELAQERPPGSLGYRGATPGEAYRGGGERKRA